MYAFDARKLTVVSGVKINLNDIDPRSHANLFFVHVIKRSLRYEALLLPVDRGSGAAISVHVVCIIGARFNFDKNQALFSSRNNVYFTMVVTVVAFKYGIAVADKVIGGDILAVAPDGRRSLSCHF